MKVGDFGFARDVYSHLYYRADEHSCIPVKWAAPEVLNDGLCTERSDVVSQNHSHTRLHMVTDICRAPAGALQISLLFKVVLWSYLLGNIQPGSDSLPWNN